tara:strand:+ start:67787 stop:69322 length:1536 start_codon:yes stop_codon:yes gene_type:complete
MLKKIRRALISTTDKSHLESILPLLVKHQVEIISTGGTEKYIRDLGFETITLKDFTGKPELFNGRVKTLEHSIYSGILFDRTNNDHLREVKENNIQEIDLVICNLYPFEEVAKKSNDIHELIENIDIGGPCMLRAAAKNYKSVCVLSHPNCYSEFTEQFEKEGTTDINFRLKMSKQVFFKLAKYNESIAFKLDQVSEEKENYTELRYGENSHQKAWLESQGFGLSQIKQYQGKELSYNNFLDMDAAYWSCFEADKATEGKFFVASIVKHNNPCGLALNKNPELALANAWAGDPKSAFGSIICFNQTMTANMAYFFEDKFVEVIMAPDFEMGALEKLSKKKNLRVIKVDTPTYETYLEKKTIWGANLIQEHDGHIDHEFQLVTNSKFDNDFQEMLSLGSVMAKALKSNAICFLAKKDQGYWLAGAGMGQPNRIDSMELLAAKRALENGAEIENCLMISDAFFPFRDTIDSAAKIGVRSILQPGGSIKDQEVIEACNEHGISMAFTNYRHFKH